MRSGSAIDTTRLNIDMTFWKLANHTSTVYATVPHEPKSLLAFNASGCLRMLRRFFVMREDSVRQTAMSVDEQVTYLKDVKGVTFNLVSEDYAKGFLENKNYFFKVKAFAKNYSKKNASDESKGVYINLDFGHLVELSKLDKCLRDLVLSLTLDIEHYLKVRINSAAMRCSIDPYGITEDYYTVAAANVISDQKHRISPDKVLVTFEEMLTTLKSSSSSIKEDPEAFVDIANSLTKSLERITMGSKPEYVRDSFAMMKGSAYSGGLIEKYCDSAMPYWCMLELMSFGQLISFYKACFKKSGLIADEEEQAFCKEIKNLLRHAQGLRNAAAHGDCLLNGLSTYTKTSSMSGVRRSLIEFGIDEEIASNVYSVRVAMDFAAILLCYNKIVPPGTTRKTAKKQLEAAQDRMLEHRDWFTKNYAVKSFLDYYEMISQLFVNAFCC